MAEKGTDESFMDTATTQLSELICSSTNLEHLLGEFILSGRHEITILLSGKTGAGKSHLTNALIGERLAEEGEELDPQTDEVSCFAKKIGKSIKQCAFKEALPRLLIYFGHILNEVKPENSRLLRRDRKTPKRSKQTDEVSCFASKSIKQRAFKEALPRLLDYFGHVINEVKPESSRLLRRDTKTPKR